MFVTFLCSNCGSTYNFKMGCHSRVCNSCNKDKSIKLIKKYSNVDSYLENPYFVTFTIRNVEPSKLKEGVGKMRKSIHKLCKRAPYRRWFAGGLYAIEMTYNRNRDDFNIHAHMTIDSCIDIGRCYMGYAHKKTEKRKKGIKQDWFDITGDSYIIDWQKTRYPKKAISYCLKYISKDVDYGSYRTEVQEALYKSRMVSFFGVLYDIETIPSGFVCECGCDSLEYFSKGCYSRGGYWYNGSFHINPEITLDNFS